MSRFVTILFCVIASSHVCSEVAAQPLFAPKRVVPKAATTTPGDAKLKQLRAKIRLETDEDVKRRLTTDLKILVEDMFEVELQQFEQRVQQMQAQLESKQSNRTLLIKQRIDKLFGDQLFLQRPDKTFGERCVCD